MDTTVSFSPVELQEFLAKTIPANFPVLIKGAPGVGKSAIVEQAAQNLGFELVVSHPVTSEPIDYKGALFLKSNDTADFIPIGDLRRLTETDKPTVFFLDDVGQAPAAVQAACMQLLHARRINNHAISPTVSMIAATNRKDDRSGVTGILEAVKSRFVSIVQLTPNVDDWVRWALKENVSPLLIAFVRFRPEFLFDFNPNSDEGKRRIQAMENSPNPRTIHHVAKLIDLEMPKHLRYTAYAGAAGEAFAAEFSGFENVYHNLPDIDYALMNPDKIDIPEDPATLYAMSSAVARKASEQNMERVTRLTGRMPKEFSVLTIRDAVGRDNNLQNTKAFIQWAVDHQDVLF